MHVRKNKPLIISFHLFILINSFLYIFLQFFHTAIPFSSFDYTYNAHHYLKDPRIENKSFNLLNALGQYDGQWYLKIADKGYPFHPKTTDLNNKSVMDGLTYNFFPLLPLCIAFVNVLFKN